MQAPSPLQCDRYLARWPSFPPGEISAERAVDFRQDCGHVVIDATRSSLKVWILYLVSTFRPIDRSLVRSGALLVRMAFHVSLNLLSFLKFSDVRECINWVSSGLSP